MILRRFTKHVTDQNWFAVGLDVLVVITGIFLGLQVAEWNETRQERVRESFILIQLQKDFLENKTLVIQSLDNKKRLVDDLYFANKIVQSGKLDEQDRKRFNEGYYYNNVLPGVEVVMGTYKALVAAGEFNIIQDEMLRGMLLKFDARIEKDRNTLNYIRDYFLSTSDELNNLLFFRVDKNDGEKIIEVDFEGLLNNREARAFLAERYADHWMTYEDREEVLVQIEQILARLEELGAAP